MLHPERVLKGVVAGVRDYGNRMGIPTVNGALVVDPGYLANPLVFCGTVGVIPRGMSDEAASSRATGSSPSAAGPAATASTARRSARSS